MTRGRKVKRKDGGRRREEAGERGGANLPEREERLVPITSLFKNEELNEIKSIIGVAELVDSHTLIGAVVLNRFEIVKRLLKEGYPINTSGEDGITAAMWAVRQGDLKMVELLARRGADLTQQDSEGNSALSLALTATSWDQNMFVDLWSVIKDEFSVEVNRPNKVGNTLVHFAVKRQWLSVLELLLEMGAKANATNQKGATALMMAASRHHFQAVDLLLKYRADHTIEDQRGCTALCYAIAYMVQKRIDKPDLILRTLVTSPTAKINIENYLRRRLDLMNNPPEENFANTITTVIVHVFTFFMRYVGEGAKSLLTLQVFKRIRETVERHMDDAEYVSGVMQVLGELLRHCSCCCAHVPREKVLNAFHDACVPNLCSRVLKRFGNLASCALLHSILMPIALTCSGSATKGWLQSNHKSLAAQFRRYSAATTLPPSTHNYFPDEEHSIMVRKSVQEMSSLMQRLAKGEVIHIEKEKSGKKRKAVETKVEEPVAPLVNAASLKREEVARRNMKAIPLPGVIKNEGVGSHRNVFMAQAVMHIPPPIQPMDAGKKTLAEIVKMSGKKGSGEGGVPGAAANAGGSLPAAEQSVSCASSHPGGPAQVAPPHPQEVETYWPINRRQDEVEEKVVSPKKVMSRWQEEFKEGCELFGITGEDDLTDESSPSEGMFWDPPVEVRDWVQPQEVGSGDQAKEPLVTSDDLGKYLELLERDLLDMTAGSDCSITTETLCDSEYLLRTTSSIKIQDETWIEVTESLISEEPYPEETSAVGGTIDLEQASSDTSSTSSQETVNESRTNGETDQKEVQELRLSPRGQLRVQPPPGFSSGVSKFLQRLPIMRDRSKLYSCKRLLELALALRRVPLEVLACGDLIVPHRDFLSRFRISCGGNFGPIILGLDVASYPVAVREVSPSWSPWKKATIISLQASLNSLRKVRSEYIVPYTHCFTYKNSLLFATPLCECNLGDQVMFLKRKGCLTSTIIYSMFKQIVTGLYFLHSYPDGPIIHGNLKPTNVLLDSMGNLRLSEFGLQKTSPFLRKGFKMQFIQGPPCLPTLMWWPQETYAHYRSTWQVIVSLAGDVQACGMVCHYLVSGGCHPFGSKPAEIVSRRGHGSPRVLASDPELNDLLFWMLMHNPAFRPTCYRIVTHVYLWDEIKKWRLVLVCAGVVPPGGRPYSFSPEELTTSLELCAHLSRIDTSWVKKVGGEKVLRRKYRDSLGGLLGLIREAPATCRPWVTARFPSLSLTLYRLLELTPWIHRPEFHQFTRPDFHQ